jgi:hypothetical protein
MHPNAASAAVYKVAVAVRSSAVTVAALVAAAMKADAAKAWPLFKEPLSTIQQNGWWLIVLLPVGAALADRLASSAGSPRTWEIAQTVTNAFRKEVFGDIDDALLQEHRVTLFKHVRCKWWMRRWRCRGWPWGKGRWPWSGWLVPVVRSGHTTQQSDTVFLAPDDSHQAEGIAGLAWASGKAVFRKELPAITANSSAEEIAEYARLSKLSPEWVRRRLSRKQPCARSLCGVPIEGKKRPWGVIVLDSAAPDLPEDKIRSQSQLVTSLLAKTLEGA